MPSTESSDVKHDVRVKAENSMDSKPTYSTRAAAEPRNEGSEQKQEGQVKSEPRDPLQGAETVALARGDAVKGEEATTSTSDGVKPEQTPNAEPAKLEEEGFATVPGDTSSLLTAYLTNPQAFMKLLRWQESPAMLSSWACDYLSAVRGRLVTINEWYDLLDSEGDFPDEAWLWIAQVEYEGYAGDRDSIREIKEDLNEAIDWYNEERPEKAVPRTIRKQCMSILGGRRRWLLRERRFETGQERSDRVAERCAREMARKAARDRERQERYEASEASSSRS
ncbi:hypothetical protein PHBOTO_005910 [Pseudozyma hubeiensis]|nr:hypothetical protein PHBOTO_005910 [Pseudozyma hubeiensis]